MFVEVKPVIDYSVRKLCTKHYYNHQKGCPNYGKKDRCQPYAKLFDKVYDLTKPVYAIYNIFDFKKHIEKMKKLHPDWSEHQLKCLLYWQGSARKQLKEKCIDFLKKYKNYKIETCPEAMGINVTETMKIVGIKLEWPP